MVTGYDEMAKLMKALGDPKRLQILQMLAGGELCACKIQEAFDISQPTLSHHMGLLCGAGLVRARKQGRWIHYSLEQSALEALRDGLAQLTAVPEIKQEELIMGNTGNTKLYVLTGFLGSGKTTLLLRLLQQLKGHRVGIIQNEFGKLGIDGTILRDDDIQMVEINRGSIFCSCLKLNFVKALTEMAQQDFEYLFVESSGLGDPSNIAEILQAAEVAGGARYDFKGVICLVDAVNFLQQVTDEETVNRQLKHCHMAVITKSDLADAQQLQAVTAQIRSINPVCRLERAVQGDLDIGFLQDDLLLYQWAEGEDSTNIPETKPKTLFMEFDGAVPQQALTDFLQDIIPQIYRSKGFFRLEEQGWMQVDVVGSRVDFKPCMPQEKSQLIFISKVGPAVIRPIMNAWETRVGLPMKLKN